MKRQRGNLNRRTLRSSEAKPALAKRSLASLQKQIILNYINVEGHGVWLNAQGQQRLADRLGMSVVQLTRLINALARNGAIQLDSCDGSPMAMPYWYGKQQHEHSS